MKKERLVFLISLIFLVLIGQTNSSASEVGGWALVDPATGEVMAVHVCDPTVCGPNGSFTTSEKIMNEVSTNAGCSVTCVYVQQSTADANGNVAGYSTSGKDINAATPSVTYDFNREVFRIESDIQDVNTSQVIQEFGFQDLRNTNGQFDLTTISGGIISAGSASISAGSASISAGSASISAGSASISADVSSSLVNTIKLKGTNNLTVIQNSIEDSVSAISLNNYINKVAAGLSGKITNKKYYVLPSIDEFESSLVSTSPGICKVIDDDNGLQKVQFKKSGSCKISLFISNQTGDIFNLDLVSSLKIKK
jgi:hypothetical protein